MTTTKLTNEEIVDLSLGLDCRADWCADHAKWRLEMAELNADNPEIAEEHRAVAAENLEREERLRALAERLMRCVSITIEELQA